jgi:hypothetical protein
VRAELISSGVLGQDAYVVVAGPANIYSHYITTREEYGIQRYEGASTIFGPCESAFPLHPFSPSFRAFPALDVPRDCDQGCWKFTVLRVHLDWTKLGLVIQVAYEIRARMASTHF